AAAAGAEAILLDDGFQNPWIEKDLSLVVIDAEYGFGNRRVIPAGPLREPVATGLARADAIVLIGDAAEPSRLREAGCPILGASLEPVDAGCFAGTRIVAFAGIGHPEKFFATLRATGALPTATRAFADHHRFAESEIAELRREAERHGASLVTTAKDWVRLPARLRDEIAVLEVEIRWHDAAAVTRLLSGILDRSAQGLGHGNDRRAAQG
ncbi:MAG TPA: tetraacyldisaccharide 4'-kinase, partial [Stellaceae bacterium]|nr:tetraacyldisaccharide 4'-kinase [Stellaceae bacterium]